MAADINLNTVFTQLSKQGIDKNFIKNVLLPEWWDEEITSTKAGYLQTLSILSKNLNIRLDDFLNGADTLSLQKSMPVRFKKASNINISSTDIWPNALAARITDLVSHTYSLKQAALPENASELRNIFLHSYNKIDLTSVLDFLWKHGIPVLYVSEFPREVNKMDGMVINSEGRHIIIVSKSHKHNAWLLFIILHELGHILRKHITSESVIYDIEIDTETDIEEKEANDEALIFLFNSSTPNYIEGSFKTAFQLANAAVKKGKEYSLDPGVLTLNYAYQNHQFPLAQQALKILDPEANAISFIKSKMKEYLALDNLSEENYDFFVKVTSLQEG